MGIQLNWLDEEKNILCHTYTGHWTVEDFIRAVDESRALLLEVEHPIDLVIDMRTADGPPKGVASAYRYADRKVPENQRLIVMVQPSAYMKTYNRVVNDIAPRASQNRYEVGSLEDALTLIQEYRSSL